MILAHCENKERRRRRRPWPEELTGTYYAGGGAADGGAGTAAGIEAAVAAVAGLNASDVTARLFLLGYLLGHHLPACTHFFCYNNKVFLNKAKI